jgi:hypothetical protein
LAAREMYSAYCEKTMSDAAARHLEKIIQPAVKVFFNEVKKSKIGGLVYIDAPYAVPFDLPLRITGAAFEHIPASEILSEFDFSIDMKKFSDRPDIFFHYLSPFLESYFDKSNSEINQKLRHRLHWLAQ